MTEERFLVTGGLGRIGAWVVRRLVRTGVPTSVLDIQRSPHRLELIMSPEEVGTVELLTGDIADLATIEDALRTTRATHIIHLAALQMPACRDNPPLGARVNVVGTVNIFEAARRCGLQRVVYASNVAAYGNSDDYPEREVPHDAPLKPHSHFGVYKQANEGTAHIYWLEAGISSIGLRPYVIYGPGCIDQDMTCAPTRAMLAAALGKPYHIPFGGKFDFEFADDVAAMFIQAARVPFAGAEVFNLPGNMVRMRDVVTAIEAVVPTMRGSFSFDDIPLPFPEAVDWLPLTGVLGSIPRTPLDEGVALTIEIFQRRLAEGRLSADSA